MIDDHTTSPRANTIAGAMHSSDIPPADEASGTASRADSSVAPHRSGPLAGSMVVELASILAGPVTGQFLAELGAEVIKIENPATGGDPTRGWRLSNEDPARDVCAYFSCANWGKSSLALDVANPAGRAIVHRLIAQADIVLVSYKPGDDQKLGLDAATLRALNPRLIYAQISAYGTDDPRPGFDAIIQAEGGFMYLNGTADGPPVKMPVALMDLLAAHQLKEAVLLALLERERHGHGATLHVSLLAAAIASLANQATNYLVAGQVPMRMGSEHPNIVPYGTVVCTADARELVLAVGTERQWRQLTDALGRADLAADPRFATNQARVRHRGELGAVLDAVFRSMAADDVAARLTAAKVPFGFVNDMAAVFEQPESERLLMMADGLRGVRTFVADGFGEARALTPPPSFNGDGRRVLTQRLGLDDAELVALRDSGAWPG